MTFGVPAALWLLALLPVIVALYMLRARRADFEVSAVLLWQRASRDLVASRPVRRLERNVLLLLQLLAVALAALALARPQLPLAGGGRATVIVLDTSASMQATDIRPSRFAAAVADANEIASRATGAVMLIEAGPRARVATPFSGAETVAAALVQARPTDGPARLDEALALALGQRPAGGTPLVIVLTDRVGPAFPGVTYHVIGASGANVAIAGMHVESGADRSHVVVRIRRYGSAPRTVPLELTLDGRRVLQRSVALPATGEAVVAATVSGSGVLRARVAVDDALRVDNLSEVVVGGPLPRLLVIGAPSRALAEALSVMPVRVAAAAQVTGEQLAAADLVILDRLPPVALPPGKFLLIGTIPTNLPVASEGMVARPSVLRTSAGHPVMRYVDLSRVEILQALALRVGGGEVLAEGEVPLIWAYDGNGIRAVVMGFTLDQTDLALQVAFPIFLHNAISWLVGADTVLSAGSPLIVPAGEHATATLEGPAGRAALQAAGGRFVVPTLDRAGVYTLRAGNATRRFTVVSPPEESDIAPVHVAPGARSGASIDARRIADLWPLCLALALIVLGAEWVLWLRGLPRVQSRAAVPVRR